MAKHLRITGLVQGIGYRAAFEAEALGLGLTGWVRNRRDGSVEAVVYGDAEAMDRIIQWSQRGPRGAEVEAVIVDDVDDALAPSHAFEMRPTE
ncbi:acylphosphatase [Oxalobacteraceae bacterium OM1]|nr:acylphosphatase [Oxalobacteraceae bacterium OM1]